MGLFSLERSLTQTLRLQQDEAYEVSLRADQEKERVRQEELERQRLEQQALDDAVQAEIDRKAVSFLSVNCVFGLEINVVRFIRRKSPG